jgi:anti-anti-sigma regulatory factor
MGQRTLPPAVVERIVASRSDDPDLARRELIVNVMALGLLLLTVLWVSTDLWTTFVAGNSPAGADISPLVDTYAGAGVGLVLCVLAYGLSRRGRVRGAAYLLIAGLLGYGTWFTCRWGIEIWGAVLFYLAVTLAGLLVGGRESLVTATVALFLYGGVGLLQRLGLLPNPVEWPLLPSVIGVGLTLYIVAILNRIADRLLESALGGARQQADELRAAREEQARMLEDLKAQSEHQSDLLRDIKVLSAPVVIVHDEIIVLPLVGQLDEPRASFVRQALLQGIVRHRAKFALIDLTGLPLVDREMVHHLETMSHAGRLLGAEVVFVGLHARTAAEMIKAGADMRSLSAQRDLQSGIEWALTRLGRKIVAV